MDAAEETCAPAVLCSLVVLQSVREPARRVPLSPSTVADAVSEVPTQAAFIPNYHCAKSLHVHELHGSESHNAEVPLGAIGLDAIVTTVSCRGRAVDGTA